MLWVKTSVNDSPYFIGAIYHPPPSKRLNLKYKPIELIQHIQLCLDEIAKSNQGNFTIILAGDFNQLPDDQLTDLGLVNLVSDPTHKHNKLDRVYVSQPVYKTCKVITSTIKTQHKAIIARSDDQFIKDIGKTSQTVSFRKRTPDRNACFLADLHKFDWSDIYEKSLNAQAAFDKFYNYLTSLLNEQWPQ